MARQRRSQGRNPRRRADDPFSRKARREGRPARSVYKLEEMDRRWHLLRPGDRVLDLGCAPGSWTQYAAQRVGPGGSVLGVDLKPLTITLPPHAHFHQGDAWDIPPDLLGTQPYDVVLSDMAPATMGHHQTDALRSMALAEQAVATADRILKPGGHVVVKLLEGAGIVDLVKQMRQAYTRVERARPQATRKQSTEIFVIGLGRKVSDAEPAATPCSSSSTPPGDPSL